MKHEIDYDDDDIIISLNWDLFDEHITKCEKCQKIQQEYFLDVWDHIREDNLEK